MSLLTGAPAPLFEAPAPVNPRFAFGSVGGRYLLLMFLPEPGEARDAALAQIAARASLLLDEHLLVFAVLPDEASFQAASQSERCIRWFFDADGSLRRLYGCEEDGRFKPTVVVIDPSMRIMGQAPLDRCGRVLEQVAGFGAPDHHAGAPLHAPVLIVPRVLEPSFCRQLIEHYEALGGQPTGVMQLREGKTVGVLNYMKTRRDTEILDEALREQLRLRLAHRLLPEIEKAFQFRATRIERYIVACYDAEERGFFLPHRDNTTPGTAHRKFAVSINLNAEAFEGGDLKFREFGGRTYRPPTGGAVVFSCSLLHEVTPVTQGRRYATLPFLYDEDGARIRAENLHSFAPDSEPVSRA